GTHYDRDPTRQDAQPLFSRILHNAPSGWVTQAALPHGVVVHSLAMLSASEGWAVGDAGVILHGTGDGTGGGGPRVASPTSAALRSVAMVSPSEGWAVGDNGTVLHYTAGAWTRVPVAEVPTNLYNVNSEILMPLEVRVDQG